MAANAVIGFPRFTESFGFSGGSWEALYPAAHLKLLPLSRVARSTDADPASTQLVATTTTARLVQLLAFVGHNASLEGSFRIRLYADTGLGVLLHDTGWQQFWPPVYAHGGLPFGDPSFFTLKYSDEELAGLTWTRAVWLDRGYVARAIKVEIDDPANSDGFFQCGLFEIAQGWAVSANFGFGAEYGFRARTQSAEALGGPDGSSAATSRECFVARSNISHATRRWPAPSSSNAVMTSTSPSCGCRIRTSRCTGCVTPFSPATPSWD